VSAGGALGSITRLHIKSPSNLDNISLMEKSNMNEFNIQKTINTASGVSFFDEENKKLQEKIINE
jgi:hypothetical protein